MNVNERLLLKSPLAWIISCMAVAIVVLFYLHIRDRNEFTEYLKSSNAEMIRVIQKNTASYELFIEEVRRIKYITHD